MKEAEFSDDWIEFIVVNEENAEEMHKIDEKAERKSWDGHEMASILVGRGLFRDFIFGSPSSTKEEIIRRVQENYVIAEEMHEIGWTNACFVWNVAVNLE